eukprot:11864686-Heterocapsa_arctica.AAC.1
MFSCTAELTSSPSSARVAARPRGRCVPEQGPPTGRCAAGHAAGQRRRGQGGRKRHATTYEARPANMGRPGAPAG